MTAKKYAAPIVNAKKDIRTPVPMATFKMAKMNFYYKKFRVPFYCHKTMPVARTYPDY